MGFNELKTYEEIGNIELKNKESTEQSDVLV